MRHVGISILYIIILIIDYEQSLFMFSWSASPLNARARVHSPY